MAARINKTRRHLNGRAAECLVEAYGILSSGGQLDGFRPAVDIDHKDIIFDEVGGYCNAYVQVKCATTLDMGVRVSCAARFFPNEIRSHPRFAYVFCLLDPAQMDLSRIWLVPSRAFNRLAYRYEIPGGKVELRFSCNVSGDPRWDKYEVDKRTLGPRLLEIATTPAKRKAVNRLDLRGVLVLRASATPSR
ncbi:MAG TPA: hypothetical protein VIO62_15260 [Candidatus Dormibacteraeota bacterium]